MLSPKLLALASQTAFTVVFAATTDAWPTVKQKVALLFGRVDTNIGN